MSQTIAQAAIALAASKTTAQEIHRQGAPPAGLLLTGARAGDRALLSPAAAIEALLVVDTGTASMASGSKP